VTAALRRGERVYDQVFDDVFPWQARRASNVHWTPVEVAVRAAKLLTEGVEAPVVLDVGAGIGKFCAVAAAIVRGTVVGVERRAHLIEIARGAAAKLGVAIELLHGTIEDHDLSAVNGVYMFNPFGENLAAREDHLDETVELGGDVFWRDVAATQRFLRRAQLGTRVVTYCGWGGAMPKGYELVLRERLMGPLELWRKTDRAA
jgi:predicted RNA methylase